MSIFKVKDLKRIVDVLVQDGIELVEIELFDRDEIEGELIGASIEFNGCSDDEDGIDYGCIEEFI
ncbi:MAG: hypothetical protein CVU84_13245 [Firmicutes bacterium HGW-Firmicutes-1]|nr:MAG: hypothetical protein CVU84_13245 [Firmicutes bacterium HGW-Firmicutes-1]